MIDKLFKQFIHIIYVHVKRRLIFADYTVGELDFKMEVGKL